MESEKLDPATWRLKRVIERQRGIAASEKKAHYVLGPGAQFDEIDEPEDIVNKRLSALESSVKQLTKRLDKVEKKHAKKKR